MKTLGAVLLAVALGQLAVGSKALAQEAPPPDPYTSPPPTFGSPPPAYAAPVTPTPSTFALYEAQRKNAGLAILLELFIPGLGSLYGDHPLGALFTWGLMAVGVGLLVYGALQETESYDPMTATRSRQNEPATFPLITGVVLLLGGRVYGFVDSYMSTEEYNRKLKVRMGLPLAVDLGMGPVGGQGLSFGPRLAVTF